MLLDVYTVEIQKQWNSDPCGASTVESGNSNSMTFYRAIRNHRYQVYGPWFDKMMRFDDTKNQDILEIGVGLGSDHLRFAQNGNRMTAVDLSRQHLRHARRHLAMEGLSTEAVYGDAEQLAFSNETFDTVYAFGVLHHTPNIRAALSEVHRVLRPAGNGDRRLVSPPLMALLDPQSSCQWYGQRRFVAKDGSDVVSEIEYHQNPNDGTQVVRLQSSTGPEAIWASSSPRPSHMSCSQSHFGYSALSAARNCNGSLRALVGAVPDGTSLHAR
jgi:ubiquinone/menaquinone biosynthesis C-methylase UbiE